MAVCSGQCRCRLVERDFALVQRKYPWFATMRRSPGLQPGRSRLTLAGFRDSRYAFFVFYGNFLSL